MRASNSSRSRCRQDPGTMAIDTATIDFFSDIFGLIGSLGLVRPAFRANKIASLRAQVENIALSREDADALRRMKADTVADLAREFGSWNRLDEICLFGGIFLVVLSFAVKIVWAMVVGH